MSSLNFEEIDRDKIKELPQIKFAGEINVVTDKKGDSVAIDYLKNFDIIGFDTETKPSFIKGKANTNKVALLQLATEEKAFIFRMNNRKLSQKVIDLLANPEIIKTGAAVKDDIKALESVYGFTPGGFADIQQMSEQAGFAIKSLRKLTAMVFRKRLSKSQRLSNWESDILTESQIVYAATDAWISLKIYNELKKLL